jgi:ubiquinone/menaquinone biosynthesis C-methylase UbiE
MDKRERDVTAKEYWDRRASTWERRADELDRADDAYGTAVMDALAPMPGERVLDIGCGPGSTTITLARRLDDGGRGLAVGVDVSAAMIGAARRRVAAAGVPNIGLLVADAQRDPLGDDFDAVFSRFGVMFFSDPDTAFANLHAALRTGGRLACVVWAPLADNPWMSVPTLAAISVLPAELAIPEPGAPGPFSLADPARTTAVLAAAGFIDVAIETIAGSRTVTDRSSDEDVRALLEVGALGEAFAAADEATQSDAIAAVVDAMGPFRTADGWQLPGLAHVVTARRST